MRNYDAGHTESQTGWPDPLQSDGGWKIGTLALPVTMLSACSATVLAVVYALLELFGSDHELFVLPTPGTFIVGAVAAALAWLIVHRCRVRPGRLWPRLWALGLACLATVVAVMGLVLPGSARLLTLAVAGLGATIALLPRLVKLPPDNAMVQHIAPLGMLIALLIVPSACAVRRAIAEETAKRVEHRIGQLRDLAAEIRAAIDFDWKTMEDNPEIATRKVEILKALKVPESRDDAELWRSAAILGKDAELFQAMEDTADATIAGFAVDRVPRVSSLREPAIHWNPERRQWEPNPHFPALSAITGSYHSELGRLFLELDPQTFPAGGIGFSDYQQHYDGRQKELQSYLRSVAQSWADNWMAFRAPGKFLDRSSAPVRNVLQAPFTTGTDGIMAPAQLWHLVMLPLSEVKKLVAGTPGCQTIGLASSRESSRIRSAPGCHCQNYKEASELFRLDCYSYTPSPDSTGANLRIEMRLVYQEPSHASWQRWQLPLEVYFQFPIPKGANSDAFCNEVMRDLASATRAVTPEGVRIVPKDRGSSVVTGFTMNDGRTEVVVKPSRQMLDGLVPEQEALVVRVYRQV